MKKKDLIEEIGRLYNLAEEAEQQIKEALNNIKSIVGGLEELPTEAIDIEDDEKEEEE